ncbi:MAG: CPBP family glutamic-type intramembrane protease [Candidatus Acidiferrales bacterium]
MGYPTITVVVKSTAAGLLLGWVFWRWGLPYSIMCHFTANATHLMLAPALF